MRGKVFVPVVLPGRRNWSGTGRSYVKWMWVDRVERGPSGPMPEREYVYNQPDCPRAVARCGKCAVSLGWFAAAHWPQVGLRCEQHQGAS